MIGALTFAALVVAVCVLWARGIDRAAVDDGELPTPLPLAMRYARQLKRGRLAPVVPEQVVSDRCHDCGNVMDRVRGHRCLYPHLVRGLELRGVVLTDDDHHLLRWLAGWERETCERILGWVEGAFIAGAGTRSAS